MNNMNNAGINQMMPMNNQIGVMNQLYGLNSPIGMNYDSTTLNIKNIIQPYENKIKELEEIIRQKDFEITVLKQKLNNSKNNMMMPNINQLNMNMGINMMPNLNNQINKEVTLCIQLEDERVININCLENDKASIINKKLNIKEGYISCNYKIVEENSTIKDIVFKYGKFFHLATSVQNIIFKKTSGESFGMYLDGNCPIIIAIIYHFFKLNQLNNIKRFLNRTIICLYDACQIRIDDTTPIKDFFKCTWPNVVVNDKGKLIGG